MSDMQNCFILGVEVEEEEDVGEVVTIKNEAALDLEMLLRTKAVEVGLDPAGETIAVSMEVEITAKNLDLKKQDLGKERTMKEQVDSTKVEVLVLRNHKTNNRMLILCRKGLI